MLTHCTLTRERLSDASLALSQGQFDFQILQFCAITLKSTKYFLTERMPRVAQTKYAKISAILKEFPGEFLRAPNDELYCESCQTNVKFDKRASVDQHRQTRTHRKSVVPSSLTSSQVRVSQSFIRPTSDSFTEDVVKAFLAADIPLAKLRNKHLIDLFSSIGKTLPSESTCRRKVDDLATLEMERIREILTGEIFLVVDESEIEGTNFVNVLAGKLDKPEETYLVSCKSIDSPINAQTIIHTIDDVVRLLSISRDKFCLLLSDAAP
jgi:hypothetical protein